MEGFPDRGKVLKNVHDLSKRSSDVKDRIPTNSRVNLWHLLSPLFVVVVDLFLVARHYTITLALWSNGSRTCENQSIVQRWRVGTAWQPHGSQVNFVGGFIQRNTSSILLPCTIFRALSFLMVINSSFAVLVTGWVFVYMLICLGQNAGQHHNIKIGSECF